MTIKFFNPHKKPYGIFSNNAYYPITENGIKYRTVTHYIYSNLLCKGIYQIMVRNQQNGLHVIKTYNNVKSECKNISYIHC